MKETNKKTVIKWLKVMALTLYGVATAMTCSVVWNSKPGVFLSVVAGLLMAANAYVIYRGAKNLKD